MRKISRSNQLYFSNLAKKKHKKFVRRRLAKHKRLLGWLKFMSDVRVVSLKSK